MDSRAAGRCCCRDGVSCFRSDILKMRFYDGYLDGSAFYDLIVFNDFDSRRRKFFGGSCDGRTAFGIGIICHGGRIYAGAGVLDGAGT